MVKTKLKPTDSFRLTIIKILTIFLILLWAKDSKGQSIEDVNISLVLEEVSPEEAFVAITEKTRFRFSYAKEIFDGDQLRISLNVEDKSVADVLKEVSRETGLSFRQVNNTIAVKARSAPKVQGRADRKHTLSGYVRDQDSGENLIGATIYDRLSGKGTVTNAYGFFSFTIPEDSVHLSISFVGYEMQWLRLYLDKDRFFTILMESSIMLDEVVVTAEEESVEMIPQMSATKLSIK